MSSAPQDPETAKHPGAPRPAAAYLSAAASAAQQAVALAPVIHDPRFPWRAELQSQAMACAQAFATSPPEQVRKATAQAAVEWLSAMLKGIEQYQIAHDPPRPPEPAQIWRAGAARLLDYGPEPDLSAAPVLLALPSLINRARIFDLTPRRSFLRALASRGVRPLLLDWGPPGPEERGFDLEAYVTHRALPAFEIAARLGGGRASVLGHCMSGSLAAATAAIADQKAQGVVSRVALMAAPWQFAAYRSAWPSADSLPKTQDSQLLARQRLTQLIDQCEVVFGAIPSDVLNTLFFALDPLQALRKFPGYAALDPETPRARLVYRCRKLVKRRHPPRPSCRADAVYRLGSRRSAGKGRMAGRRRFGAARRPDRSADGDRLSERHGSALRQRHSRARQRAGRPAASAQRRACRDGGGRQGRGRSLGPAGAMASGMRRPSIR